MLFRNFETYKLQVANSDLVNIILLGILLLLTFASVKKKDYNYNFLDEPTTTQLKGISILLILIGHLWTHAVINKPYLIMGGYGVEMFFLLSGYGLTVSFFNKRPSLWQYLKKRASRLFVPYWISTAVIILLDFLILHRLISPDSFILTLLGINVSTATSHLDYARWFITLLIIWYILHFSVFNRYTQSKGSFVLLAFGFFLFLFNYYFFDFGWYQVFAFPAGCFIAAYKSKYESFFLKSPVKSISLAIFALSTVIIYQLKLIQWNFFHCSDIMLKVTSEIFSLCFCLALINFFESFKKYLGYSQFLYFIGAISFEMFLLHGPFLIKYNPVISSGDTALLSIQFTLFVTLIIGFSFLFHRMVIILLRSRS